MKRVVRWSVDWAIMLIIWLLLAGKLHWDEAAAGAAGAILAAAAAASMRAGHLARFRPRIGWLAQAWRIPAYFVTDSVAIFSFLLRRLIPGKAQPGELTPVPFDAGSSDARSAARRALALIYMTSTPNSIVVEIDRKRNRLLLHRLAQAEHLPGFMKELGAQ